METFNGFLRGFLILSGSIIFPAVIIYKFFLIKRKNKVTHPALDQEPWAFGDEWQKTESMDMTNWEEIMTVPQDYYKTHLYDFGSEIMKLKKTDLGKVQIFLAQNGIASKIILSTRSRMPADGLFVEKNDVEQANKLLQNESSKDPR